MTTAAAGTEYGAERLDPTREKQGRPSSTNLSLPDKLAPSHHAESTAGAPSTTRDTVVHRLSSQSQNRPAEPVRNYRLHQGTNRFCLDGRCMTSGDSVLPLVGSSIVALLLPALFWAFNGPWLWHHLGAGGGGGKATVFVFLALVLLMWSSMVRFRVPSSFAHSASESEAQSTPPPQARTALSDPGILPRNLDPDPPQRFLEPDPDIPGSEGEWIVEVKYIELPGKGYVASKCPSLSGFGEFDGCKRLTLAHAAQSQGAPLVTRTGHQERVTAGYATTASSEPITTCVSFPSLFFRFSSQNPVADAAGSVFLLSAVRIPQQCV